MGLPRHVLGRNAVLLKCLLKMWKSTWQFYLYSLQTVLKVALSKTKKTPQSWKCCVMYAICTKPLHNQACLRMQSKFLEKLTWNKHQGVVLGWRTTWAGRRFCSYSVFCGFLNSWDGSFICLTSDALSRTWKGIHFQAESVSEWAIDWIVLVLE